MLKLLRHAYGQAAAVAVPGADGTANFLGRFPAGVDELIEYAAAGAGVPGVDWFFLVGGPGNGKSRAVHELAARLALELPASPADRPTSRTMPDAWPQSAYRAADGREFVFINDASIERPSGADGLGGLSADLRDALAAVESGRPLVLFANVNRGILVEEKADFAHLAPEPVGRLLDFLASTHNATSGSAPYYRGSSLDLTSGPLRVHVVSLDVVSLLEPPPGGGASLVVTPEGILAQPYSTVGELHAAGGPGERGISVAGELLAGIVAEAEWAECSGCAAAGFCPFQANAAWLRDQDLSLHFLDLLRAAEVTQGWRLTYRELLAELANAILGGVEPSWSTGETPCDWVRKAASTEGLGPAASLALHRSYASLFGGPALTAAEVEGLAGPRGPLAASSWWFRNSGHGRSPRVNAACIALRPTCDSSPWAAASGGDLKHAATQAVEVLSVDPARSPAAWLGAQAGLAAAVHSAVEAQLDGELGAALSGLQPSDPAEAQFATALLKLRLHLLLSQLGLALGRMNLRAEVVEYLRTQKALLDNHKPSARVRMGLQNLLVGTGRVSLLSSRASTSAPAAGASHVAVEISGVDPTLWSDGDQLMVQLYPGDPGMPVSFELLREMLVAPNPDAGFTDIADIQLARVERARAKLVSRQQSRNLTLEVTLEGGRRFRLNPAADQQKLRLQEFDQ